MTDPAALVKKAEATLKGGLFNCLSGTRRFEEAMELYQQAANMYKLAKLWQEAADCYSQCAYCAARTGDQNAEADNLQEAGHLLKRISTERALDVYDQAVNVLSTAGRFPQAGKLLISMAELVEKEQHSEDRCIDFWRRAAEMFDLDDHGKSNSTKCNLKVAEFAALRGELDQAIKLFEAEGEKALKTTTLQFGAKEHFFKAGIVHLLVGDSVTVNLAVERYCSLDPRFADSREGALLAALAKAFEEEDTDLFTERLSDYDSITKLDHWKTDILLKVKNSMKPAEGVTAADGIDLS
mmetsp:Transcript_36456/g.77537  ORF Transcript_36456/g.77537 Transcript_36456/m.77537 type:complete len:296 (-) Transcript_36456:22-909(-)